MGYSIYVFDEHNHISKSHAEKIIGDLKLGHRKNEVGMLNCDFYLENGYLRISGSWGISGNKAERFTLEVVLHLVKLGYHPIAWSDDLEFCLGTPADYDKLQKLRA